MFLEVKNIQITFLAKARAPAVWSLDSFLPAWACVGWHVAIAPGPALPGPSSSASWRWVRDAPAPALRARVYIQRPAQLSSVRSEQCSCSLDTCRLIKTQHECIQGSLNSLKEFGKKSNFNADWLKSKKAWGTSNNKMSFLTSGIRLFSLSWSQLNYTLLSSSLNMSSW